MKNQKPKGSDQPSGERTGIAERDRSGLKTAQNGAAQIVILAGGLGTRLRPITEKIPKPMVEVRGQPFLHWQIQDCKQQGYRRFLLLVAYLGEKIEEHFGDGSRFGVEIEYAYETEPLGTGGAIVNAFDKLEDDFVLLNGDSFLRAPLGEILSEFRGLKAQAGVVSFGPIEKIRSAQVPVLQNLKTAGGHVLAYKKNGGSEAGYTEVDAGIYYFKKSVWVDRKLSRFQVEDVWPKLIEQKQFFALSASERFYDIGTPERLREFEEKLGDYFPNAISN